MSRWGALTPAERFWTHVDQAAGPNGCWPWQARIDRRGYGFTRLGGRPTVAHRFVYEVAVGPIPIGLEIDHLCRNKVCVNPRHLEAVTHRENCRRALVADAMARRFCKRGHAVDPWVSGRYRYCVVCHRDAHREYMRTYRRRVACHAA